MKEEVLDFYCDCKSPRCGRVRFVKARIPNRVILDVCFVPYRKRSGTIGVIIEDENYDKLVKFLEEQK